MARYGAAPVCGEPLTAYKASPLLARSAAHSTPHAHRSSVIVGPSLSPTNLVSASCLALRDLSGCHKAVLVLPRSGTLASLGRCWRQSAVHVLLGVTAGFAHNGDAAL